MSHEKIQEKQLVLLLAQHQRRIFSYIYTLVPNRHDAEDLLQETSVVICDRFEDYRPGSDFVAWACQIAWWRVKNAQKKFVRSKVTFDETVMEKVAMTASQMTEELDMRYLALEQCLGKLHDRDREMVVARYEEGGNLDLAAERCGRTKVAAHKALGRIRKLLHDCVTHQLSLEGGLR